MGFFDDSENARIIFSSNFLRKKYEIESVPSFIEAGVSGRVFKLNNKFAAKLVSVYSVETDIAKFVVKKKIPNVVPIHGIYKISDSHELIVEDFVHFDRVRSNEICDIVRLGGYEAAQSFSYTEFHDAESKILIGKFPEQQKYDSLCVLNGIVELRKLGLIFNDLHGGNIGFLNNEACIVDIGCCIVVRGTKIPNRRIINVTNK